MSKNLREIFNLPPVSENLENYLADLTKIGRRYGIGITSGQLFVLERDDYPHKYTADAESVINLT